MTDNEFILNDRLQKIRQVIRQYGEDSFCISYSGGKDSTVLSELIDMALPGNMIPRLYADTGIELNAVRDFVMKKAMTDSRIIIIQPATPIREMLNSEGYPFKSKSHSKWVDLYQRNGMSQSIHNYLGDSDSNKKLYRTCPKILSGQFKSGYPIRISDRCCKRLKVDPIKEAQRMLGRPYGILGIRRSEGGRRITAKCMAFSGKRLLNFSPMAPLNDDWIKWVVTKYDIDICKLYRDPYNMERTGCKGCPFARNLQGELDMLKKWFPGEYEQCKLIWGPVYQEYIRLGYRIKHDIYNE